MRCLRVSVLVVASVGWFLRPDAAVLEEYVLYTASDSASLAASTVERFALKNGFECPYVVIRPVAQEVKAVVVLLHGAGDNPRNAAKVALRLGVPLTVIAPRAPFPLSVTLPEPRTGEPRPYVGYSWVETTPGSWCDRGVAFSVLVVDRVVEGELPSVARDVPLLLLGIRQGAGIALLWAAANPGKASALVAVGGHADPLIRHGLEQPGRRLEGFPVLLCVGPRPSHAVEAGTLAASARHLGVDLSFHGLGDSNDLSDDDYAAIREFLLDHARAARAGTTAR